MAKTTTPPAEAKPTVAPADAAAASIRAITGCGVPESKRRVAALPAATVTAIAKAETSGKRNLVPELLAKAANAKPKPKA